MPLDVTPQPETTKEGGRFLFAFLIGAAIVLVLIALVVWLSRPTRVAGPGGETRMAFGPREQAYAERIHFQNLRMARATNFLNQEITYVYGDVWNNGVSTIREMQVTLEFRDSLNQVDLRESRTIISKRSQPFGGGQRRSFEIALEHIPADWDQQFPSLGVTGLVLE